MNQLVTETGLIFNRSLTQSLRSPAWIAIGIIQPLLYLALFGPLLIPVVRSTPGFPPGDAWQILAPALLVQLALFGSLFVGFGLINEHRSGVVERLRVTPVSRVALLLGRALKDAMVIAIQAVLLLLVAMLFGLRAGILDLLACVVLVAIIGLGTAALSYALALQLKDENAFAPLMNSISLPVLLLSGVLLPMTLAPAWLFWISRVNPFVYLVDGARAIITGNLATATTGIAALVAAALTSTTVAWGVRTFRREST